MIQFLINLVKPYKKIVLIAFLLQIGQTICSLLIPMLNASVIDYGVANHDVSFILIRGLIMVVIAIVQYLCYGFAIIEGARGAFLIGRDLRARVYKKILSFSQEEIGHFGAPTLITRATNDIEKIVQFFSTTFTVFLTLPLTFLGGIIMAVIQSLRLSAVLLVTIPIIIVVAVISISKIIPYFRKRQLMTDKINGVLRDQITGIRVVKAFNKEEVEKKKLDAVNLDLCKLNTSINRLLAIIQPLFIVIVNISTIALLWYGGYLAEGGFVGVGQIISFITYLALILSSTLMTAMMFIMIPQVEISSERIEELLNTNTRVKESENPLSPVTSNGEVEFNGVSYSYAPESEESEAVIKDINFTAKPGEMTAIIGSTGSGKTTLLNLIPRLADTTEGDVFIDGINIKDYPINELNSMIGLVPQKAFLFKGTLAENLRFSKPDATDEELWEALRIAQAEEFVKNNEKGLEMEITEGGSNLSGGQRQRLAIARAVVRKPQIYLFDDSFSALDYRTDRNLRAALKEASADSTMIVIAQRVTSIKNAEQIIVLNNGEIEAKGTHDELLETSPTYQEIVASQPVEEEENE